MLPYALSGILGAYMISANKEPKFNMFGLSYSS